MADSTENARSVAVAQCTLYSAHVVIISKNPLAARDLVRGDRALRANLIYLEYQSAFAGSPGRHTDGDPIVEGGDTNASDPKIWRFYGSPGSPIYGGQSYALSSMPGLIADRRTLPSF